MSVSSLKSFQDQVSELLLRHRSLLDVISKFQQTNAAVNRSVTKAITECGCIEVSAQKQQYSLDYSAERLREMLGTHVHGHLCEQCQEIVSSELGRNLFYMSALCNLLEINLEEVIDRESQKCSTLGFFNMS
ncbi:DUF1573 domain-containing protein [Ferviditalea candida]|uniref:DUF1573 domain-containing protein n=1 Tax=Ferviditalea candida TaxID=3108399 RepID=A0ABU5ZMB9_9BACL|nr:DUF1573 domain-containing protein [Paenibacillaceae bacterium T2]